MSGTLHMAHNHQSNKMTYMQAVGCGVETNIKSDFFLFQQLFDLIFVGELL